jgi:DNA-binding transcriptional LysR family regulator
VIFEALERLSVWPGGRARASVVRVATSPTLAHRFLPPLIAGFRREEADVTVQIEIGQSPSVVAAVADRLADIGIVDQPPAHPGIRAEILRRSVAHVALPKEHPLAGRETLAPQDLAGEDLIALVRRFTMRSLIDRAFVDAGVEQRIVAEVATLAFAIELVREGMGVAVLNPFPVSLRVADSVVFRRFRPGIQVETAIISSAASPTSPAARRLIDFIRRRQPEDGLSTAIR